MDSEQNGSAAPKRKGKRVKTAICAVALALLFFAAGWLGAWLSIDPRARDLLWAVDTAKRNYYREVDEDALYEEFYAALALDPYSAYYTAEENAAVMDRNAGLGADCGITVSPYDSAPRVYRVAGCSPADLAGVRAGMYVLRFGASEAELRAGTRAELAAFLSEAKDIVLECGEEDGSGAALYAFSAAPYRVSYCEYRDSGGSFRFTGEKLVRTEGGHALAGADGDTAYIALDRFYGTAAEEFELCLRLMKERGRSDLILDLRANGGGYLDVFREIAVFLMRDAEGSRPVVATARRRSGKEIVYRAEGNAFHDYFGEDSRITVLADEGTASASECLLGALVSYGTIGYGDIFLREEGGEAHTYGKGIMQSTYGGSHGQAYKITVAEMFWPDGTSIHGRGVTLADGAVGVPAPRVHGEEDAMLRAALAR